MGSSCSSANREAKRRSPSCSRGPSNDMSESQPDAADARNPSVCEEHRDQSQFTTVAAPQASAPTPVQSPPRNPLAPQGPAHQQANHTTRPPEVAPEELSFTTAGSGGNSQQMYPLVQWMGFEDEEHVSVSEGANPEESEGSGSTCGSIKSLIQPGALGSPGRAVSWTDIASIHSSESTTRQSDISGMTKPSTVGSQGGQLESRFDVSWGGGDNVSHRSHSTTLSSSATTTTVSQAVRLVGSNGRNSTRDVSEGSGSKVSSLGGEPLPRSAEQQPRIVASFTASAASGYEDPMEHFPDVIWQHSEE